MTLFIVIENNPDFIASPLFEEISFLHFFGLGQHGRYAGVFVAIARCTSFPELQPVPDDFQIGLLGEATPSVTKKKFRR